jgi:hypothetical protein
MSHKKGTQSLARMFASLLILTGIAIEAQAQSSRSASATVTISATLVSGFTMPTNAGNASLISSKSASNGSPINDFGTSFPEGQTNGGQGTLGNLTSFSTDQWEIYPVESYEENAEFGNAVSTERPAVRTGSIEGPNVPVFMPSYDPNTHKRAIVVVFVAN